MNDHSHQPAAFWRAWNNRPDNGTVTQADRDLLRALVFDFNLDPAASLQRIAAEYPDYLGDLDTDQLTERACMAAERLYAGNNIIGAGAMNGHVYSPYRMAINVLIEKLREREITSDAFARYADVLHAIAHGIISEIYDQFERDGQLHEDFNGASKHTVVGALLERPDDASVGAWPFLMRHILDPEWKTKEYDPDYLIPSIRTVLGDRGHLTIETESKMTGMTKRVAGRVADPKTDNRGGNDNLLELLQANQEYYLSLLPDHQRRALIAYYGLEGNVPQTMDQIAAQEEKRRETVSDWIHRGLGGLRRFMDQEIHRGGGKEK